MDLLSKSVEKLQLISLSESRDITEKHITKEWIEDLTEHSSRGNPVALFSLAQYYLQNNNNDQAIIYFHDAASKGNGQAMYQLAVMYYEGIRVEPDLKRGFTLMLQVAQSQRKEDQHLVPAAQFNIGKAYYQGFGTKQNDEEALKWWTLSAQAGTSPSSVRSMNTLALFYSRPERTSKEKAYSWHRKAAELGHSESMAAVGLLHLKGEGCVKSREHSLKWLKKSAECGSIYGTGLLAYFYYSSKLYSKAIEIAQRLCDLQGTLSDLATESGDLECVVAQGLATAYYIYGQCLYFGQGVTRDESQAAIWFDKVSMLVIN